MSLIKLQHDCYMPPSPDTTEEEYYEHEAAELYLLVVSPMYNGTYYSEYHYPWILHLRQSLNYINLECLKRLKVFHK